MNAALNCTKVTTAQVVSPLDTQKSKVLFLICAMPNIEKTLYLMVPENNRESTLETRKTFSLTKKK